MAPPRNPIINYLRVPPIVGFDPLTGTIGPLGLTLALLGRAGVRVSGGRIPGGGSVRVAGVPQARERRVQPSAPRSQPQRSPTLDPSALNKAVGGRLAEGAGNVVGLGTGALDAVSALVDASAFVGRLADPFDRLKSSPGQSATEQLIHAASDGLDFVRARVERPELVAKDVRNRIRQGHLALNPYASRVDDTLTGELGRRFAIGRNQGELVFNGGMLLSGPGALKSAAQFGGPRAARYVAEVRDPILAEYFSRPYQGRGAHFTPRRAKFPERIFGVPLPSSLAGKPLPREYIDSQLNVLTRDGATNGEAMVTHYLTDDRYHGGPLPEDLPGRGWSGRAQGWERYGPLGRFWYGAPTPLKWLGAGAAVGLGATADEAIKDWEQK